MKYFKYFFVLLFVLFIIPFSVFAEGEEGETVEEAPAENSQSNEVRVYLFRGDGCPHCQEAEEWFQSIEEEYGNLFEIIDYETWYNEENADLMQKVADARKENAEGVPYIIIGNKSWNGFAADYEDEIIEQIKSEYDVNVENRYDIMKLLPSSSNQKEKEKKSGNDVAALLIILVVVGGVCFGIYKARNSTN